MKNALPANGPAIPARCPLPTVLRRRLEAAIDRLIAALDALDAPDIDREDSHDMEAVFDDAEPSLGSTSDVDQRIAWRANCGAVDGEASGTEDDLAACASIEAFRADQAATAVVVAQLRCVQRRRSATASMGVRQ
jgi:hypothetical protein